MRLGKSACLFLSLPLLSSFSLLLAAQSEAPAAAAPAGGVAQLSVKSTQVAEIDSSHLRIAVDLTALPSRTITLEDLRLTGLRLNGLPVYAEPLAEPIELIKGKETALPPLYITLQVRDITTTKPLREMIEAQSVHLTGAMVAAVKMSFLEKLALHTEHPRISLPVAQDVPVAFGSSPFARQAALGALTVIDLGLAARKVVPGLESPWVRSLENQARSDVLTIDTSFQLKGKSGQFPMTFEQLGFRLASGQVVTTAESSAPWEYDADLLGRMKSGEAKLEKRSVEMQLRPCGAAQDSALLLTRGDFTLEVHGESGRGKSSKDPVIVAKSKGDAGSNADGSGGDAGVAKVQVRRRAEPGTLAILILHAPPSGAGFHAAPAAVMQQESWERVAIYRLNPAGANGGPSIEVVQLSARRDGQGIHLDESVDPTFYGSPIVAPEGVLGVVQDERAGAFLPADLAASSI